MEAGRGAPRAAELEEAVNGGPRRDYKISGSVTYI